MSTKEAVEADSIMFQPVADVVMLLYLGSRMFGLMLLSFVSFISLILLYTMTTIHFCPIQSSLTQFQAVRSLAKPDYGVFNSQVRDRQGSYCHPY